MEFLSTYRGQSDYRIDGRRVHVQFLEDDCIKQPVGTVMIGDEYPGPEVMARFPGYVAARYNPDIKAIETSETPRTTCHGGDLMAAVWAEELKAAGL